jgi:hypothetical protein
MTHSNLLFLARITSLHDAHKMGMFSLLLSLGSPTSGRRNVDAILGHDREPREARFGSLLCLFFA